GQVLDLDPSSAPPDTVRRRGFDVFGGCACATDIVSARIQVAKLANDFIAASWSGCGHQNYSAICARSKQSWDDQHKTQESSQERGASKQLAPGVKYTHLLTDLILQREMYRRLSNAAEPPVFRTLRVTRSIYERRLFSPKLGKLRAPPPWITYGTSLISRCSTKHINLTRYAIRAGCFSLSTHDRIPRSLSEISPRPRKSSN